MQAKDKMPPHEKKEITEEEAQTLLKRASLRQLNVFDDVNHIVYLLCTQLLKEMKKGRKED